MRADLARKRPATVSTHVAGQVTTLPRYEIVQRRTKAEALATIKKMSKGGEIGSAYDLRQIPTGWAVKVTRIQERPRFRWGRLVTILTLGTALVWGLAYLATVLLALAPYALALAVLASVISLGGGAIYVSQSVTIKR